MAPTGRTRLSLTVNGVVHEHEVEPRLLLVHYLRDVLGLTGTHVGCDTSQCGACTVHLDGRPVKSCTVLAASADGSTVTTIEGLRPHGQLHPLQEAFWQEHGLQCGFCTSRNDHDRRGSSARQPDRERRGDSRRTRWQPVSLHRLPQHRARGAGSRLADGPHDRMPAQVPGNVIPPESLPGGILSSPTGAEINVPDKTR